MTYTGNSYFPGGWSREIFPIINPERENIQEETIAMSKRKLTPLQSRFVDEYLIDLNATGAASRAGYSDGSIGRQLITLPHVAEAIQKAKKRRERRTQITADYVLKGLQEIHERCVQAVQVLDKNGNPTGEWKFDAANANKALELLGRHLKLFVDKLEIRVIRSWADLSDEERQALIDEARNFLAQPQDVELI